MLNEDRRNEIKKAPPLLISSVSSLFPAVYAFMNKNCKNGICWWTSGLCFYHTTPWREVFAWHVEHRSRFCSPLNLTNTYMYFSWKSCLKSNINVHCELWKKKSRFSSMSTPNLELTLIFIFCFHFYQKSKNKSGKFTALWFKWALFTSLVTFWK
jgi:hypothetical protein